MEGLFEKYSDNPWWSVFEFEVYSYSLGRPVIIRPVDIYQTKGIKMKFQGLRWKNSGEKYELTFPSEYEGKFNFAYGKYLPLMINNKVLTVKHEEHTFYIPCESDDIPEFKIFEKEFRKKLQLKRRCQIITEKPSTVFPFSKFHGELSEKYSKLPANIRNFLSNVGERFGVERFPGILYGFFLCFFEENSYKRLEIIRDVIGGKKFLEKYQKKLYSLQGLEKKCVPSDLIQTELHYFVPEEIPLKKFCKRYEENKENRYCIHKTLCYHVIDSIDDQPAFIFKENLEEAVELLVWYKTGFIRRSGGKPCIILRVGEKEIFSARVKDQEPMDYSHGYNDFIKYWKIIRKHCGPRLSKDIHNIFYI